MRWLIAVAWTTLLYPSSGAEACQCGQPDIQVWPFRNDPLPLNPQIRITWGGGDKNAPRDDGASISLVTRRGAPVATRRRTWIDPSRPERLPR